MKFETPKMSISMFANENVVITDSAIANSDTVDNAKTALSAAMGAQETKEILTFTF